MAPNNVFAGVSLHFPPASIALRMMAVPIDTLTVNSVKYYKPDDYFERNNDDDLYFTSKALRMNDADNAFCDTTVVYGELCFEVTFSKADTALLFAIEADADPAVALPFNSSCLS
jgi:hypothetical protein